MIIFIDQIDPLGGLDTEAAGWVPQAISPERYSPPAESRPQIFRNRPGPYISVRGECCGLARGLVAGFQHANPPGGG